MDLLSSEVRRGECDGSKKWMHTSQQARKGECKKVNKKRKARALPVEEGGGDPTGSRDQWDGEWRNG